MNYGELAQFAFDNTLEQNKNTLSVWNIIEKVSFVVSLRELSLVLSTLPLENHNSTTNFD